MTAITNVNNIYAAGLAYADASKLNNSAQHTSNVFPVAIGGFIMSYVDLYCNTTSYFTEYIMICGFFQI